jgi:uncharacterized protein (TIGR02996 family)
MTPDEAAFLKAIADNPADETARLVYADFLAERDDPRAAFARLSAEFLRCVRGLAETRPALPADWVETVDPLFGRLRFVHMSWQHYDGDTVSYARVASGSVVTAGQVLFDLESDRMSNELRAEEPGVVVSVLAKTGDRVEFGRPVLTYLRLPVAPPLAPPPPAEPALPLAAFIRGAETAREGLRGAARARVESETNDLMRAARMVFGGQAIRDACAAAAVGRGWGDRPYERMRAAGLNDDQRAQEVLDLWLEALRILARGGQPTGFAEPPAATMGG